MTEKKKCDTLYLRILGHLAPCLENVGVIKESINIDLIINLKLLYIKRHHKVLRTSSCD